MTIMRAFSLFTSLLLLTQLGVFAYADDKADTKADDKVAVETDTDEGESATDATPEDTFATELQKFNDLRADAQQLLQKMIISQAQQSAPETSRQYGNEFLTAKGKIRKQMPILEAAAVKAYEAAPNEDREVIRVLLAMIHMHLEDGETGIVASPNAYRDAKEIADLLAKHNVEEKAAYGLLGSAAMVQGDDEMASKYLELAEKAGILGDLAKYCVKENTARQAEAKSDDLPRVKITTNKGEIVVELFEDEAPGTVGNFISLAEDKFYDGVVFHRVLANFMAQTGDPKGDGTGGPGYTIFDENEKENRRAHFRGSLSMAHSNDPQANRMNTGGSQFFICFNRTAHLDGRHTVFGRVIEGMEVVDSLQLIDPNLPDPSVKPDKIVTVEVLRKREHEYKPDVASREEIEEPKTEEPKTEEPKTEEPKTEEPNTEEHIREQQN